MEKDKEFQKAKSNNNSDKDRRGGGHSDTGRTSNEGRKEASGGEKDINNRNHQKGDPAQHR